LLSEKHKGGELIRRLLVVIKSMEAAPWAGLSEPGAVSSNAIQRV